MVPENTASRFAALVAVVDGLTYAELDRLAGSKAQGHAKQIAGGKEPRAETLRRYAAVLGATPAFLLFGDGDGPADVTVRSAVKRAREAALAGEGHSSTVRRPTKPARGSRVQRSGARG